MDLSNMTPEEQVLYTEVFVPAFIEKCASRGITFPDQETLEAALETTALVTDYLDKQAGNAVKSANLKLKTALGIQIVDKKAEATTKSAAFELANNPSVRAAVLKQYAAKTQAA